MGLRRRPRLAILAATVALLAAGLVDVTASRAVAVRQIYTLPTSGNVTVVGHGNGHGHGMSQYGARGAAAAGLSSSQILAFYYQRTNLVTLASSTTIRVRLSGGYANTTVRAASGLTLRNATGALMHGVAHPLPTTGVSRYRLAPAGAGLRLQRLAASGWADVRGATALPARADFVSTQGYVRLDLADGSSTDYRDQVGALRSGAGELTINRVNLDRYTMGVVPREMPASWAPAAVHAQAIAARTYGTYGLVNSTGDPYDICDTDQCQVYGGMRHYDSAGHVVFTDDPAAVNGTSYQVLRYAGHTIFAQFSASDGGWTADGGQPYLAARADPYDNAASGDPYLNWSRSVAVSSIASYYGLARATSIQITGRDGNGQWGGRVISGIVNGLDRSGATRHVATTGFALQSAMGLPHHWFAIQGAPRTTIPGAPTSVRAVPADTGAVVSWMPPTSTGGAPITGYTLSFGTHTIRVSAAKRSAFAGPRANGSPATIIVRAVNARGAGAGTAVTATPKAAPHPVNPLPPARLFDTRIKHTVIDSKHLFRFDVAGRGGVPAHGAKAVQFALTIANPAASGVLTVHTWGAATTPVAAIAYRAHVLTTATLTVSLLPSTVVAFAPSAGSVALLADLMGYAATTGQHLGAVAPRVMRTFASVPTGAGAAVPVRSVAGVPAATSAVVLSVAGTTSGAAGWLRLWSDGTAEPKVSQVSIRPGETNTNIVVVPVGASGAIRLAASSAALGATVTLVGVFGPAGPGRGLLESFPPNGIAEGAHALRVSGTAQPFRVTGAGQVPASGVASVLLHLTVRPGSGTGALWAYPAGAPRPSSPAMQFGGSTSLTSTVLVPVSANGAISFVTSGPTVIVAVDAIGYLTTG